MDDVKYSTKPDEPLVPCEDDICSNQKSVLDKISIYAQLIANLKTNPSPQEYQEIKDYEDGLKGKLYSLGIREIEFSENVANNISNHQRVKFEALPLRVKNYLQKVIGDRPKNKVTVFVDEDGNIIGLYDGNQCIEVK